MCWSCRKCCAGFRLSMRTKNYEAAASRVDGTEVSVSHAERQDACRHYLASSRTQARGCISSCGSGARHSRVPADPTVASSRGGRRGYHNSDPLVCEDADSRPLRNGLMRGSGRMALTEPLRLWSRGEVPCPVPKLPGVLLGTSRTRRPPCHLRAAFGVAI
jgi:hypothetical protein